MVRRRIEIRPIENSSRRHTTFTKRRQGLMKKAEEFFEKTESVGAVITFSKAGNLYAFANPDVDTVLNRRRAESSSSSSSALPGEEEEEEIEEEGLVHGGNGIEEASSSPLTEEVRKRIVESVEKGRLKEAVVELGEKELDEVYAKIKNFVDEVVALGRELAARESEIAVSEKDIHRGGSSAGDLVDGKQ